MISQAPLKHQDRLEAFQKALNHIEQANWKSALQKGCRIYNLKSFNVEKLTPQRVRQLYQRIHQRFYLCQRSKNGVWIENELRLFIWILVLTSQINNITIEAYGDEDWELTSKIFQGKSIQTCKFQYKSITNKKVTPWNSEQEELLTKMIEQRNEINPNWNQISRDLFNLSGEMYFKTSKQCREHWNNYLNPNVSKDKWNKKQDYLLMKHVVEKGKQWAMISKILESKRTEHMVKNRFKSIVLSYSKQFNVSKKHSESLPILQKIYKKIKGQFIQLQHHTSQTPNQNCEVKQKQIAVQSQIIKSAFQFVNVGSPTDSTTIGMASSPGFSPCSTLSFQLPSHQLFSRFVLPMQLPIYNLNQVMHAQTFYGQNSLSFLQKQE